MDPITLAAITGGFAAVKTAVEGVRSVLSTTEDISQIASHIDNVFSTHREAKKRVNAAQNNKLKGNKWAKFIKLTLKDDSDDETAIANVAAAKLAEKQHEEDILKLSREIDKRFGVGTWAEILDEQKVLIEKKKERIKKRKKEQQEEAERKALGQKALWQKILIEFGKILLVIAFILGGIVLLMYVKK
tara:strand:- start:2043 stop:2606 length:564 start_codon:yes stop_codon:yes gene_type:complete